MTSSVPNRRACWLVLLPLALLLAPLFFTRSWSPAYAIGVATAWLAALAAVALVARRCRLTASPTPAHRALLLIGVVAGTLFATEIVGRWRFGDAFATYARWGQERSWLLLFETAADHRWEQHGASYSTDARGFRRHLRRPDWADDPAPSGARVFVLGGSSAFGFGLRDDETWPHRLDALLAEKAPGSLVVNAANNGHNSLQALMRLSVRVLPERPTHVVYYEAINDVDEKGTVLDLMREHAEIVFAPSQGAYLWSSQPGRNPYARTVLWSLVEKRMVPRDRPVRTEPPSEAERAMIRRGGDLLVRHLTAMADACRRGGAQLVCCTFLCDAERLDPYFRAAIHHLNERLRELARAEGLPLVDLAHQLAAQPVPDGFFFADHYHPAWKGAEWIADRVAEALVPLLGR